MCFKSSSSEDGVRLGLLILGTNLNGKWHDQSLLARIRFFIICPQSRPGWHGVLHLFQMFCGISDELRPIWVVSFGTPQLSPQSITWPSRGAMGSLDRARWDPSSKTQKPGGPVLSSFPGGVLVGPHSRNWCSVVTFLRWKTSGRRKCHEQQRNLV